MSDYSGLLREFDKAISYYIKLNHKPTKSDVEQFVIRFADVARSGFLLDPESRTRDSPYIFGAKYKDIATGEALFDVTGKTTKEIKEELVPLLEARVEETFGKLGEVNRLSLDWDPKPRSNMELAALFAYDMGVTDAQWEAMRSSEKQTHPAYSKALLVNAENKARIIRYNEQTLPFRLRKTMHHPLAIVKYASTEGKIIPMKRNRASDGKPFTINTEKQIQDYLSKKTVDGIPAAKDEGLRSVYFVPSVTGEDVKMGVFDLDNPGNVASEKVMKGAIKKITSELKKRGHEYIIMFTGSRYQIWFLRNKEQELGNYSDVKLIVRSIALFTAKDFVTNKREIAKQEMKVLLDEAGTNRPNQPLRMFFDLHYKKDSQASTGLAAVPVAREDLDTFNPMVHAHPDAVLMNFAAYSSFVAEFFDKARIGQEYETKGDIEAEPACLRGDRDRDHKLLELLDKEVIPVESRNILMALDDEEDVHCFASPSGIKAVLHYNSKGGLKAGGRTLKVEKIQGKQVITEPVKAYFITRGGVVIYEDYICREIERYCKAKKIEKLTIVGTVSKFDQVGENEGSQAVRAALEKKEGLDPKVMRKVQFTCEELIRVDKLVTSLPIEKRFEVMDEISTPHIKPAFNIRIVGDVAERTNMLFQDLRFQRAITTLNVEGEYRYEISSRKTINAVIMGIPKDSVYYEMDSPDIRGVYVAVAKESARGLIYHFIAKATIALPKEERIKLKQEIRGENAEYVIQLGPRVDRELAENMEIVEPKVVVQLQYDGVSDKMTGSYPHVYRSERGSRVLRAAGKGPFITALENASVIGLRKDLSPRRSSDIGFKQDKLIEITHKRPREGLTLLGGLPNPNNVRKNSAAFGVPESRKITLIESALEPEIRMEYDIDGKPIPGTEYKSPVTFTGRTIEVDLIPKDLTAKAISEAEFGKAYARYKRDEPGYKVIIGADKSSAGTKGPRYYTSHPFPHMFEEAVDDVYGYGGPFGTSVVSMDRTLEDINYAEQLDSDKYANKKQRLEDLKIVAPKMFESLVGENDTWADMAATLEIANKKLSALKSPVALDKTALKDLIGAKKVRDNPAPIKENAWNYQVNLYSTEFEKWEAQPEPKEEWEKLALTMFPSWQVPLLDKERKLRNATVLYGLTEEEITQIDSSFGEPFSGEILESMLSDLYEEDNLDDESNDEDIEE